MVRHGGGLRRSLAREPVRVGEGPGIAANHEPVQSGAVGRDAGVLGEGTARGERQLDRTRRSGELDLLAAKALGHGEAAVNVEPLARVHVHDSSQEHDLIDLPGGRAGVLLRRGRDLSNRPGRGLVRRRNTPERLRGWLQRQASASRAPMRPLTVAGWETMSDSLNPRKPVIGASEARWCT
jgi:hypothetical protein